MDWLHHPKFVFVRDEVLAHVKRREYRFRQLATVIFLCGGLESLPRRRLADYLKQRRQRFLVFYAEAAWIVIAEHDTEANALAAEEKLAAFADAVLIVVESPGTFAEFGAFAIVEALRCKLLPLLDIRYKAASSFIETGPVRWVDRDSLFRPSIWLHQNRILEAVGDIEERLDRIPESTRHIEHLSHSPKHLLFFVFDLVSIFGPCPGEHLNYYLNNLIGLDDTDIGLLLGLGKSLEILNSFNYDGVEMYFSPLEDGQLSAFHYTKKHLDVPTLRARIVGVMQACDACKGVLEELGRHYAS